MGDCPTTFNTPAPLLRRLIPSSSEFSYADPALEITVDFAQDMDNGVTPVPGDFVLTVDDVVKTIDTVSWDDNRHLSVDYSEAVLGPTVVELRFSTKTANFITDVDEFVTPFDIIVPVTP